MQYTVNIVPEKIAYFMKMLQELKRLGIVESIDIPKENTSEKAENFISKWAGAFQNPTQQDKDPRFTYLMEKYQ